MCKTVSWCQLSRNICQGPRMDKIEFMSVSLQSSVIDTCFTAECDNYCVFDELAFVMTENWEEFWEVGNPQTEPDPSGSLVGGDSQIRPVSGYKQSAISLHHPANINQNETYSSKVYNDQFEKNILGTDVNEAVYQLSVEDWPSFTINQHRFPPGITSQSFWGCITMTTMAFTVVCAVGPLNIFPISWREDYQQAV